MKTFDIIKYRKIFYTFSLTLVSLSILLLVVFGLKPGIDFKGGSIMDVEFTKERPAIEEIRSILGESVGEVVVQGTDNNSVLARFRFVNEDEHRELLTKLREKYENNENKVLENRFETTGPSISAQLRERSVYMFVLVVIAIVLYVAYAFRKVSRPVESWKYGMAAIVALVHDVLITMGVFVLLGKFMGVEVNIPFLVALITILGYSVNDTIVVFDRIRENLIKKGSDKFVEAINESITQTFARSLNTSLTTLLALVAVFIFGGDTVRYFALALIIGISFGTYSSIFVASPILVSWKNFTEKRGRA